MRYFAKMVLSNYSNGNQSFLIRKELRSCFQYDVLLERRVGDESQTPDGIICARSCVKTNKLLSHEFGTKNLLTRINETAKIRTSFLI